jgi:flavin-dependent dehydrogenase
VNDVWDVIVIGAGPAGSAAAIASVRTGLRTLLLDRSAFPRTKVCGGCVSPAGLRLLHACGVSVPMTQVSGLTLWSRGRSAPMRTHAGGVVERSELDRELARAATRTGATFFDECSARVASHNARGVVVQATHRGEQRTLRARVVICAGGLQARSLEGVPELATEVWTRSRMGLGTLAQPQALDTTMLCEHAITMLVAPRGYVGFARLHDGRWDIAAAVERAMLDDAGGAAAAIASIVAHASGDDTFARQVGRLTGWKGTPLLTRRREHVEAPGIFVAGDAAAYAEPFTGEGMTWAMETGLRAGECASQMARGVYEAGSYQAWWRQRIATQQRRAMRLARVLRVPGLVHAGVRVAGASERVARLLTRAAGSWSEATSLKRSDEADRGRLA